MVGGFVSIVVTAALFQACIVLPASASQQAQSRASEVAKVRKKIVDRGVGPRATVEVQLRNGTRLFGIIYEANDEDFTLIEIPTHRPARCLQPPGQVGCDDGQPDTGHRERRACLRT